ncbi:hypothetical protein [Neisseria sp. Ec49-e6-T10]|uniref:hypothetical protein n=1 Tax=Neisseria sp. Ec49-e6-T10 TaxID=3140744 RepID=UPI003EBE1020
MSKTKKISKDQLDKNKEKKKKNKVIKKIVKQLNQYDSATLIKIKKHMQYKSSKIHKLK